MSQQGAARPSDESDGGGAAGGAVPPEPRAERPRPQFGEYAPEGWTWKPPAGEHTSDPAPQMATPPSAASARPVSIDGRPERRVDRLITIMLLVVGVLGMWGAISTLQSLPDQLPIAIRQASDMLGTDVAGFEYVPGPEVPGILLAGSIAQIVLWVLTAWWSIARLRTRKIAFWVPLSAGVVSIVLLYATMFVVVLNDPTLVQAITPS